MPDEIKTTFDSLVPYHPNAATASFEASAIIAENGLFRLLERVHLGMVVKIPVQMISYSKLLSELARYERLYEYRKNFECVAGLYESMDCWIVTRKV